MGKVRAKSRKTKAPYAKPEQRASKQYFGCIYRYRLTGVPPGHFLHNTPYFGQTLRWVTSHQAALDQRHSEHVRAATTQTATTDDGMQALGLHEAMRQYGVEAFELTMLATFPPFRDRTVAPTTWQPWADEEEVRLIDENGGVMRYFANEDDDDGGCQTFNLTPGGQANTGGAQKRWEALWARSQQAWLTFESHLLEFQTEHGHMKVPSKYKTASGYPLGQTVRNVRKGQMLDGHPERWEWLDSQPGWAWNVQDDYDLQAWLTFESHLLEFQTEHGHMKVPFKYKTASGYPLGQAVNHVRHRRMLNGHPDRIRWLLDQPGWKWLTRRSPSGETDATRRAHWEQVWQEQKRTACTSRDSNPLPKTGA